jgi:alkylation response protein AidB-like acyl-CoA dehydrogenase
MDFKLSEEQQLFKTSINNFLSKNYQTDVLRKMLNGEMEFPSGLWEKIAELGWLGVAISEDFGGSGMGFQELVILFEEMGRACLISPILSTVLSSLLILEAGDKQQKENYLPKLAGGELIFALALHEPGFYYQEGGIQVKASKVQDGYVLDGLKAPVPDGKMADYFICLANTGDRKTTLFIVKADTPGVTLSPLKTIAGDGQVEIRFNRVGVSPQNVLGVADRGWPYVEKIISKAALLKSAEMLGGSRKTLEMCVEYMKVREQFGQALGNFQAVQHKCAEMLTLVDLSRDIVYKPAWMIDRGMACSLDVAMAKAWTSDAYRRVVQASFQLFGAIAFCQEHDMHLYLRHAKASEVNFGDSTFQRDVIADHLFA